MYYSLVGRGGCGEDILASLFGDFWDLHCEEVPQVKDPGVLYSTERLQHHLLFDAEGVVSITAWSHDGRWDLFKVEVGQSQDTQLQLASAGGMFIGSQVTTMA